MLNFFQALNTSYLQTKGLYYKVAETEILIEADNQDRFLRD
jgi:hypothetical protein